MSRRDPLLPKAAIVARREYGERVRSRLFHLSTLLLATLAVLVAFAPLFARAVDRGTVTTVGVVASDAPLAQRAIAILDGVLNATSTGGGPSSQYRFEREPAADPALRRVADGTLDALLVAIRDPGGRIDFTFYAGESISGDLMTKAW